MQLNTGGVHYKLDGPGDASPLVLINGLGANLQMWEPQICSLAGHFRVLRYDVRGHGSSAVPLGPYTIGALGQDLLNLLDALAIARVHVCGLSLGGVIAQWLAIHAPDRVNDLVLSNTAAYIGTKPVWNSRIARIREAGMESIAREMVERWFTPSFMARAPQAAEAVYQMLVHTPVKGYIACAEALRDADFTPDVPRIHARTLIISSSHDPATPASQGRWLGQNIRGAQYVELAVSHMSNIEAPHAFNDVVLGFLTRQKS